ncbi:MAG: PAS domain S-box protein [bacterium]|nr:PAS domain S-box protein [bacterium]
MVSGETDRWIAELEAEVTERKQAEKVMRNHRDHLKTLVQECTTELSKTIVKLEGETTERKRAEEALRESEARLAEAQRIANLGSWDWNLETNKFCCSEEAYRILGMGPQESCPSFEDFLGFVHPDDREFVKKAVDEAIHERKPFSIDHRTALPEGSERVVHQEGEVFRDEAGRPVRMAGTIHDITERKRAEEALEQSFEELGLLYRAGRTVTGSMDLAEVLGFIVQETPAFLGATQGYVLLIDEDRQELVGAAATEPYSTEIQNIRIRMDEPSASVWVLTHNEPLVSSHAREDKRLSQRLVEQYKARSAVFLPLTVKGRPLGVLLYVHDQHEGAFDHLDPQTLSRFADQTALAVSNAKLFNRVKKKRDHLDTLIEQSTDAIIATDRYGKITLFNEGAEALSGYRREEVIGKRAPVLYESEEDAKEVMRRMREDGGTISAFETVFKAKDGSLIPVLISASLLFDEDGQEAGTVGFSKDLRERKRREDEIRILKEFNENVVQSVQDGLLTLDRDFRITFWNKAMEEIRGFKAEEVLGKVITEVFPHVIEQGLDELFQTALDGKVVEGTNFSYQMSNGETVYTNERFLPLKDQAGAVIGALSIVEDVTETLRLEERVIQLQEEIKGRKLVEIAKGVLMREVGLSEAEGYKFIQKKSRDENRKMGEVAKLVIQLHGSPEERKKFT